MDIKPIDSRRSSRIKAPNNLHCVLALCISCLSACAPMIPEVVQLMADASVNQQSAIAVDIVAIRDDKILAELSGISASEWFSKRDQYLRDHGQNISTKRWELVPGQMLADELSLSFRHGSIGSIVFANYLTEGVHRVILASGDDIVIMLGAETLHISTPGTSPSTRAEPIRPQPWMRVRPWLDFQANAAITLRRAQVTNTSSNLPSSTSPCFCSADKSPYGYYPNLGIKLAIYPLGANRNGTWLEGIGLFGDFQWTKTSFDITPLATVATPAPEAASDDTQPHSFAGGLAFRLVPFEHRYSPSLALKTGYFSSKFILGSTNNGFPSSGYSGPFIGLQASIPLHKRTIQIELNASYRHTLATHDNLTDTLGEFQKGYGFHFDAQAVISLTPWTRAPIYVSLGGSYDLNATNFLQPPTAGTPGEDSTNHLNDHNTSFQIATGIAL